MSPFLDAIRAFAALMVLAGHALGLSTSNAPTWPKEVGVVIFFLLSGFLISRTLHRRLDDPGSTFTEYAIDRWARIYSGFFPALLLVAAIDGYTIAHYPGISQETVARFTVPGFFANLFMLQAPAITLPFGSAAPFWTVAIEFWIYIFVGLTAFALRDGVSLFRVAAILASGIIPVQSFTDNNLVLIPWLIGAAIERVHATITLTRLQTALLAAAACALAAWQIANGDKIYAWRFYIVAGLVFLAVVFVVSRIDWASTSRSARMVTWWASWSYSLYLLHHTILMDFAAPFSATPRSMVIASVIAIVTSICFAALTENHHRALAAKIKQRIFSRAASPLAPEVPTVTKQS
jgi:peptidoglycan/LPS O-acetylase OafA/YrhL